tara:strand:+ start:50 stop:646 length:597 start_codon:yes stop_codon:yes gene_type:complete
MEPYYQRNIVVNNKKFTYKGIFRSDELFRHINKLLEERGYEKREKKTEQLVTEQGSKFHMELRPFKDKVAYVRLMIKLKIDIDNITHVVEEREGVPLGFDNGQITVSFDSWVLTDYENRWGMKPFMYLLKGIINKFLYTFPQEASFPGELVGDTAFFYVQIKKFLDAYSPKKIKMQSEDQVRQEIEKEIVAEQKLQHA